MELGPDYNFDINGMVYLGRTEDTLSFLVVHDNKYPDEDRVGIVFLRRSIGIGRVLPPPDLSIMFAEASPPSPR